MRGEVRKNKYEVCVEINELETENKAVNLTLPADSSYFECTGLKNRIDYEIELKFKEKKTGEIRQEVSKFFRTGLCRVVINYIHPEELYL